MFTNQLNNFINNITLENNNNREIRFFNKKADGSKEILSVKKTNQKTRELLNEKIRQHLNVIGADSQDLEKANEILERCLRYCNLTEKSLLKVGNIKKVMAVIDSMEVFGSAPPIAENSEAIAGETARNFLKYLFSNLDLSPRWITREFITALVFNKNDKVLKELRTELQIYFNHLHKELNTEKYSNYHSQKLVEIAIANALSLYTFFEPADGSSIQVPKKINDRWELVDYTVHAIQMTPNWMGDPYFAYGLRPKEDHQADASSLLVFMGTPPPTTKGVLIAEWTDMVPGYSVGETVYQIGKDKIANFVSSCGSKVEVMGQSLGGSLSLIYASDCPEKVSRIFAYNPPAPWPSTLKKWKQNTKDIDIKALPEVNVFRQEKDFASILGAGWDDNWSVYRILSEKSTNPYESHIRAFSGQRNVMMLKMDIKADNRSLARRMMTVAGECLRVPMFVVKSTILVGRIFAIGVKDTVIRISRFALPCFFKDVFEK